MSNIEIRDGLDSRRWKEYKRISLEAAQGCSLAFPMSEEEAKGLPAKYWKEAMKPTDPYNLVWFALSGTEMVGMINFRYSAWKKTRHRASIVALYVKKGFRGKGVGSMLLKATFDFFKANGMKIVMANSPDEASTLKFFESHGFNRSCLDREAISNGEKYMNEWVLTRHL